MYPPVSLSDALAYSASVDSPDFWTRRTIGNVRVRPEYPVSPRVPLLETFTPRSGLRRVRRANNTHVRAYSADLAAIHIILRRKR